MKNNQTQKRLHPLAAKDGDPYNRRIHVEPKKEPESLRMQEPRNSFHRDRDRILYSRSFRRMMHKTQVSFTGEMNEHLRTRLTHTLEVAQIARSLARAVGVHEDLTEAIALGHDVGHTPFGHIGERTLSGFLSGEDAHIWVKSKLDPIGQINIGFKHNYQSVRLLSEREKGYFSFSGLNLTIPVLEGILKHSKLKYRESKYNVEYEGISDNEDFYMQNSFASTIEGQLVSLADEIAQVSHDVEDAIEANFASKDIILQQIEDQIKNGKLSKLLSDYPQIENLIDKNSHKLKPQYCKEFVSILIGNIVLHSIERIQQKMEDYYKIRNQNTIYQDKTTFYPIDMDICSENAILKSNPIYLFLKDIQERYIVNDYSVISENEKGRFVIRQLLKAYLSNPLQLPDSVLLYYSVNCKIESIGKLLLKQKSLEMNIRYISDINDEKMRKLVVYDPLFLRTICDYISSMTDLFAISEYQRLYGMKIS
ncbi:dNTP triphosphohydrolase [Methanospirillum purgamenti]|uniref:DNTP triphosphohydrolase n=1 Tax=Methanospirillum hungatei TaxID=2203 RepID=A0A8F5ZGQ5_METHU|nr:dNTP triphosphohydrolase [Methanospirillum hungatei]QXO96039.1 dNTP triphosphohydrolase [Methanospirillum hungatei]